MATTSGIIVRTESYAVSKPPETNFIPLITVYTAASSCTDRWMLTTRSGGSLPTVVSTTPLGYDTLYDYKYVSCLFGGFEGFYQPGVCPDGHTLAGVEEWNVLVTGSLVKTWDGQCCSSGLTYNTGSSVCTGTFSTPVRAYAAFTVVSSRVTSVATSGSSSMGPEQYYFYYTYGPPATTLSSITTLTTGVKIADPYLVRWAERDISIFPPAIATSVASIIGVAQKLGYTPAPSNPLVLPSETNPPPGPESSLPSGGLSKGAKAGIGVGAALGAAILIGIAILFLCIRRRRHGKVVEAPGNELPEMVEEGHNGRRSGFAD